MAWVATVAVVVGTAVSAYSQYQQGKAQKAMASYNKKLAENDAIAKMQETQAETARMRDQNRRLRAQQQAGYAKSGAVTTSGTPLLVQAEQAGLMELDVLQMQRSGKMASDASLAEAKMHKFKGKQAYRAGLWNAGATLIKGAGSAYGTYSSVSSANALKQDTFNSTNNVRVINPTTGNSASGWRAPRNG